MYGACTKVNGSSCHILLNPQRVLVTKINQSEKHSQSVQSRVGWGLWKFGWMSKIKPHSSQCKLPYSMCFYWHCWTPQSSTRDLVVGWFYAILVSHVLCSWFIHKYIFPHKTKLLWYIWLLYSGSLLAKSIYIVNTNPCNSGTLCYWRKEPTWLSK